jgi:hypothetical protein
MERREILIRRMALFKLLRKDGFGETDLSYCRESMKLNFAAHSQFFKDLMKFFNYQKHLNRCLFSLGVEGSVKMIRGKPVRVCWPPEPKVEIWPGITSNYRIDTNFVAHSYMYNLGHVTSFFKRQKGTLIYNDLFKTKSDPCYDSDRDASKRPLIPEHIIKPQIKTNGIGFYAGKTRKLKKLFQRETETMLRAGLIAGVSAVPSRPSKESFF